MEEKTMETKELVQGWRDLYLELKRTKKINFGFFNEIFSQTFSVLCQHAEADTISKKNAVLIAEAFLFANTDVKELDSKYLAALVLTERMLNCCVFQSTPSICEGAYVYIFEARRDIYLDFTNVTAALAKLEKLFEDEYWKGY